MTDERPHGYPNWATAHVALWAVNDGDVFYPRLAWSLALNPDPADLAAYLTERMRTARPESPAWHAWRSVADHGGIGQVDWPEIADSLRQQRFVGEDRPMPGDAVRLAALAWGMPELAVGSIGVLDGMAGKPFADGSITFNASVYRDDRVIRCSGGPGTIVTPASELTFAGSTVAVRCWRFRDGIRRAHNGMEYTATVPLWDWRPGRV